jgi:hypothetical protein
MVKRTLYLLIAGCLLSLSSCIVDASKGGTMIKPSSKIAEAKFPQEAFDQVENRAMGNIWLVQSEKSSVILSAPENYIDLFEFKNEGGELDINFKKDNINIKTKDVVIIIYSPTLRKIKNSGAADVHMDSLTTDKLEIKNSGVGAFNLTQVNVQKLDVSCSGLGSITVSGQADEADYSCSGVGHIKARNLTAREVEAVVSGVGGIECYASEYIKGSVTGVGGLKYAGHPARKDLNRTMTGGITEL